MAEAHRLLRVAGIKIGRVDPATPAARWCVAHYFKALKEAIALYRSAGFREVSAFNDDPYAHVWFEKRLARRS